MSARAQSGEGVGSAAAFAAYLAARYTRATARHYAYLVERYRGEVGAHAAASATYAAVVAYLGALRDRGAGPATLAVHLAALKAYYAYLLAAGVRADHPCRSVALRERADRSVSAEVLYTPERLAEFYRTIPEGAAGPGRHAARTRVAVSLLVNQALTAAELVALRVSDVDLRAGRVAVAATARTAARRLPLKAAQVILIDEYVREAREWYAGFRAAGAPAAPELVLSLRGGPLAVASVADAVNVGRAATERLVVGRVRQSAIAALLAAGHDVRVVQAFAGHATPTTTERYRGGGGDALAEAIWRLHPLR